MKHSVLIRMAAVPVIAALSAGFLVGDAAAQSRPPSGGAPSSFFAHGYALPFGGSSSVAMSGVSVSVSPQGGVGVNILNLGASQSFAGFGAGMGRGNGVPGFSAGLSGVPGFSGGSLFNWLGMNGLNVQVGGGGNSGGGVSVNIANIALSSNAYFGGGFSHRPDAGPRRSRPDRGSTTSGGNGGSDGGDGGGGTGGSSGGEGGGGY